MSAAKHVAKPDLVQQGVAKPGVAKPGVAAPGVAQECAAQAGRLELRADTAALLRYILGEGAPATQIGRYQFLATVLEERPNLRTAVHDGDEKATRRGWAAALSVQPRNLTFLHGLAVLHREEAARRSADGETSEPYWVVATALWVLLLVSPRFWTEFWAGRAGAVDRDELLDECLQSVLTVHAIAGRRALLAGGKHRQTARVHLRCLDMCRKGLESLRDELRRFGVACDLPVDASRLARARDLAGRHVGEWAKGLVSEAERVNVDPEAIQRLPKGLRKNYEGAIDYLGPFVDLGVPDLAVLRATLGWYNDWCIDLYNAKEIDEMKRVMARSRPMADQLVPLCTRGSKSFLPENGALSQHFMLRGFVSDDPERSIEDHRLALEWDRTNSNAENLLADERRKLRRGPILDSAKARDDWETAQRELRRILAEPGLPAGERGPFVSELSESLNNLAVALADRAAADEARFSEALTDIMARVRRRPGITG